ncbi:MAG TPA: ATP-binding protein [Symbiobacteriaceae bacterium]
MKSRWFKAANTLFWRLMLAFGSVVVATLLVSSGVLNTVLQSMFEHQQAVALMDDAKGMAIWAEQHMNAADIALELPWVDMVTEGRLWLVNTDRVVLADTGPSTNSFQGKTLDHPWVNEVLSGKSLLEQKPSPWISAAITSGVPVTRNGQVIGAVFVFESPNRLQEVFQDFSILIGLTVLGSALAGLLAAYTLSRSFSRPIEEMSRFAADLGNKRFAADLKPGNVKELDHLGASLVVAARQLQTAFDALVEEKQRIQSLIQDMAEGVIAVDERNYILLANPASGRALGLPGPFEGQALDQVGFPTPLVEALKRGSDPACPEHNVVNFACGGAELCARVSPVITQNGHPSGAVALLQDVTSETQLRRLRENFVANVSHELRGPLASLSAGVEAMHDELISEQMRPRFLKVMLAEIGRLRRLVDDLLELSRLDAGMLQISLEEFDLRPVCDELAEKWEPRALAASVNLVVDCPHIRVIANYDRVEEILTNFLDNAVRFTESGGTVRLFACDDPEMVTVGVQDTGVGIAREHLAHIWDRFYKVDQARTRTTSSGTGLGLAIVKQLVERLGGEVSVTSAPDKGSTFTFTLVAARSSGNDTESEE